MVSTRSSLQPSPKGLAFAEGFQISPVFFPSKSSELYPSLLFLLFSRSNGFGASDVAESVLVIQDVEPSHFEVGMSTKWTEDYCTPVFTGSIEIMSCDDVANLARDEWCSRKRDKKDGTTY